MVVESPLLKFKNRIPFVNQHGAFLGEGRVELLHLVEKYGSIFKPAQSMKISYLKAWKLIDSMHAFTEITFVLKASGSKGGGDISLTEEGKKAITLFTEHNLRCEDLINLELKNLFHISRYKRLN